jgi:hypothetical protein
MTKHVFLLCAFAVVAAGAACDRVVDLIVVPDGGFALDAYPNAVDTGFVLDAPPFIIPDARFILPDAPAVPYDAPFVAPFVAPVDPAVRVRRRR